MNQRRFQLTKDFVVPMARTDCCWNRFTADKAARLALDDNISGAKDDRVTQWVVTITTRRCCERASALLLLLRARTLCRDDGISEKGTFQVPFIFWYGMYVPTYV